MKIGYIVETPVTVKEKRMVGGQISFISLISQMRIYGIEAYVVVAEKWELTDILDEQNINYITTPIHAIFVPLNGRYKKYHGNLEEEKANDNSRKVITKYFSDNNVQLIHINSEFCGIIGAQVAHEMNIPYVFHIREFLEEDFGLRFKYEDASRKLISEASLLIAISESVHSHLKSLYPKTKISTIYNGIDEKRYSTNNQRFTKGIISIAIVGRVIEYKGQFDAIRAVEKLIKEGNKDIHLSIIGYNENDPSDYERMIYKYVIDNSLVEYIRFVPFTKYVERELEKYDIGLMCSRKEAFGRVTVEYMMANMLVIGANTGGTPEIITHGENGYMYEPGDINKLAELIFLAKTNIQKSLEMIEKGKNKALATFSCKRYVENVIAAYNSILG